MNKNDSSNSSNDSSSTILKVFHNRVIFKTILTLIRETSIYKGFDDSEMEYCLELYKYDDWYCSEGMLKSGHVGLLIDKIKRGIPMDFSFCNESRLGKRIDEHQFDFIYNSKYKDRLYTNGCVDGLCKKGMFGSLKRIHQDRPDLFPSHFSRAYVSATDSNHVHVLEWLKSIGCKPRENDNIYYQIKQDATPAYKWMTLNFPSTIPTHFLPCSPDLNLPKCYHPSELIKIQNIEKRLETARQILLDGGANDAHDDDQVINIESDIIDDITKRHPLLVNHQSLFDQLLSLYLIHHIESFFGSYYNSATDAIVKLELDISLQLGSSIDGIPLLINYEQDNLHELVARVATIEHLKSTRTPFITDDFRSSFSCVFVACIRQDDEAVEVAEYLIDEFINKFGERGMIMLHRSMGRINRLDMSEMLKKRGITRFNNCCWYTDPNLHPSLDEFRQQFKHDKEEEYCNCIGLTTLLSRHGRKDLLNYAKEEQRMFRVGHGGWRLLKHMSTLKKSDGTPFLNGYHFVYDSEKSLVGTNSSSCKMSEELGRAVGRKGSIALFDILSSIVRSYQGQYEVFQLEEGIDDFKRTALAYAEYNNRSDFIKHLGSLER